MLPNNRLKIMSPKQKIPEVKKRRFYSNFHVISQITKIRLMIDDLMSICIPRVPNGERTIS